MDLIKKFTYNNSVVVKVLSVLIILISVCFIGFMVGKFIWFLSH
jgi:hypothetical protein